MSTAEQRFTYPSAAARRELIAQVVKDEGYCTILELATWFGVSEMTVRRDVARLVLASRVRAFHGGVGALAPNELLGSDYRARDQAMSASKRAIAQRALEYVRPGSGVAIDAGTTAAHLASHITPMHRVKVVTQSLPVVSTVAATTGVELECLGGDFHSESQSFSGPATLAAISNIHIDTFFLAASGLNDRGAFCANGFDAITKRAIIDVADTVILLADSSKLATSATVRICGWDSVDRLIIDDGLSPADRDLISAHGVEVEVVSAADVDDIAPKG